MTNTRSGSLRLIHESHIHGQTIIRSKFPDEYREIIETLTNVSLPLRPAAPFSTGRGAPPKRQKRGSTGNQHWVMLPADLKQLNLDLDQAFKGIGWTSQPIASKGIFSTSGRRSKGDFEKNGVFVEVEFGNTASLFRDFFKFQVAAREGVGKAAVIVTALSALARFHDSGITTYEKVLDLMPYLSLVLQMPIWVIGIAPASFEQIANRYEEMHMNAEAHGIEPVRAFADQYRAPSVKVDGD